MSYALGIIGAGNMAEAIARGVLRASVLAPTDIIAADVTPARRALFAGELKIKAIEDPSIVARESKTLLLSVKPQQMAAALATLAPAMDSNTLVVSNAAGISSSFIEKHLGGGKPWRVIRTMPNTPMLVGEGMVAMAAGSHASADDLAVARKLFEAAAKVIEVREEQIDAVTAVSGSGPAYFFFLVEQMIAAGVSLGLSPEQAHQLATQTALGAAKMLTTSKDSPAELRRKVTSPGGTTHAAITHMQSQHVDRAIIDALNTAAARGKELGQ
jgi:pyrroline-5-carboxylate reductase